MTNFIEMPYIMPGVVERRDYQAYLAGVAIQKNSLIVLPTGLGKTIIVILAAAYFLSESDEAKVVMTAPTRPLVQQHLNSFRSLLDIPEWEVSELSGSIKPADRKKIWENSRVVITTPQVLRNDILEKRVNLKQVHFLCIDECHKLVGNDASVLAAEQYRLQNPKGRLLGITASPGNRAKILEIIKNLGASDIEYKDEEDPDVKKYIFERKEETIYIDLPDSFSQILKGIQEPLGMIVKELKDMGVLQSSNLARATRATLVDALERVKHMNFEDEGDSYKANGLLGNAMRLSHAYELLETQGIPGLHEFFQQRKSEYQRTRKGSILRFLRMPGMEEVISMTVALHDRGVIHPKVDHLKSLVSSQLEHIPDGNILVFANYRTTVKILSEELNKLPGVRARWFVGQSSSRDQGLSQKDQVAILGDFRSGGLNVLVSTSVAEEGLDVAQCDLVVFYDIAPSATRLIQRAGRTGRKRVGRVIMLIARGTRDEAYYYATQANRRRLRSQVMEVKEQLSMSASENREDGKQLSLDSTGMFSEESLEENTGEIFSEKIMKTTASSQHSEGKAKITVDVREKGNVLIRQLMLKDIEVEIKQLPVGDYQLSDRVGVERKTLSDLKTTLYRGDLFNQIIQLKESYQKPILLIEGFGGKDGPPANAFRGLVSSALIDFEVSIIFTSGVEDTVEYLVYLATKEQIREKRPSQVKTSRLHGTMAEEQIALIAQLPRVNRTKAVALLQEFGTPRQVFTSSQDELVRAKGIGKTIADRIDLLLSTPFDESQME